MAFDAIILTGGRASRLGGVAKAQLTYHGQTLLERTLAVVESAGAVVVVGDEGPESLSADIVSIREDPPYSGPAAGVAAGVTELAASGAPASAFTVVLACDMPEARTAVRTLVDALPGMADADGVIAIDADDRLQPLAAIYRTVSLATAIAEHRLAGTLNGLSMFRLVSPLEMKPVSVPAGSTDDIDTWADADMFGVQHSTLGTSEKGTS